MYNVEVQEEAAVAAKNVRRVKHFMPSQILDFLLLRVSFHAFLLLFCVEFCQRVRVAASSRRAAVTIFKFLCFFRQFIVYTLQFLRFPPLCARTTVKFQINFEIVFLLFLFFQ